MDTTRPPVGARFAWALRTYAWMVLACVLALAAVPLLLEPEEPTYQADALVVARQLGVPEKVLPRLGEAVFASGVVEARVAADPTVPGDPAELIPERLSLVAAEDSIVLVVQARDSDPVTSARLATLGATVLAEELNRGGAGIGEFALQAQATVPTAPLRTPDPRVLAGIGAVTGLALGLGLVALTAVIRRPVVTAADVAASTGVPLLGTVRLPRARRGSYDGPLGVAGITTVTRWVATVPPGRLLFISPRSAVRMRRRLFVMVAVALDVLRRLRFEAPAEVLRGVDEHRLDGVRGRVSSTADDLVLVDGGSPLDVVDPTTGHLSVVAVVPLGVPRRQLRELSQDYVGSGLVGVVLVDVRLARRPAVTRRAPAAAAAVAPADPTPRVSDVPEPERA